VLNWFHRPTDVVLVTFIKWPTIRAIEGWQPAGPDHACSIGAPAQEGETMPRELFVTCRMAKWWFVDERPEAHELCLNRHDDIADTIDVAKDFDVAKEKTECML
jgi:hypothetical protein